MGRRDRLIELGARIKALRKELRELESEFDRIDKGRTEVPADAPGGLAAKALDFMGAHPGVPMSAEELARALKIGNMNTARAVLSRLNSEGRVIRRERGQYAVPPKEDDDVSF